MTEATAEKIAEKIEKKDKLDSTQVLELDVKQWFKDPVTQKYMAILNAMNEESRVDLMDYLDANQHIDAHQMKLDISTNYANRELLGKITDVKNVIEEFKEYDLLIKEVAEDANNED